MPALLQTAVSFHIPYSVNEKSSLLLCPGFRNINLRTPGSFGTLFPRGSDDFQDKFARLRQVNNSNSQDKFQICCTDMFGRISSEFRGISRVFVNFAGFRGYT